MLISIHVSAFYSVTSVLNIKYVFTKVVLFDMKNTVEIYCLSYRMLFCVKHYFSIKVNIGQTYTVYSSFKFIYISIVCI